MKIIHRQQNYNHFIFKKAIRGLLQGIVIDKMHDCHEHNHNRGLQYCTPRCIETLLLIVNRTSTMTYSY
jgi:hypothetical protein